MRLFKQISIDDSFEDDEDNEMIVKDINPFGFFDKLIKDVRNEVKTIEFESHSQSEADEDSSDNSSDVNEELAKDNLYDEHDDIDLNRLEIELGSSKLPRLRCANHKLNLAIKILYIYEKNIITINYTCNF